MRSASCTSSPQSQPSNQRWYYLATVVERVVAGLIQVGLAVAIGPWQLAAFGALDILGAAWTALALALSDASP